jgi:hypothetical protein
MSVADRLVRLYPAAFRDRWGEAMVEEVRAAGWRAERCLTLVPADR